MQVAAWFHPRGKQREDPVEALGLGDICVTLRVSRAAVSELGLEYIKYSGTLVLKLNCFWKTV